jgi:hypothetical protein
VNPLDELNKLAAPFPPDTGLFAKVEHVPSALIPEPYKQLLVHEHHMTLAMEQFHSAKVCVKVLDRVRQGDFYSRKIILTRADTGRVVQFGYVRFDLSVVTPDVQQEILAEQTPLGRILINYNILRHIDLGAILRIEAGPSLARLFDCPERAVTYGRLATIFCNHRPAVDLLEVSAPCVTATETVPRH